MARGADVASSPGGPDAEAVADSGPDAEAAVTESARTEAPGAVLPSGVPDIAPPSKLEAAMFYLFALVAVGSAVAIVLTTNIVRAATWLLGTLGSVAALYFLLAANFLGAIQLIVYAGGTLILIIFGVMLTSKSPWVHYTPRRFDIIGGGVVVTALCSAMLGVFWTTGWNEPGRDAASQGFSIAEIGNELLTSYLVPFEVASILLLAVMIGAAYLARTEKR